MFKVALCEDEKIFSETQKKICREIFEKFNIEHSIDVFENSKDFFTAFSNDGQRYDLILLDIVMDGMNGMELAKMIRDSDQEAEIVFVTSSSEYALGGYDVGALHYLMKPVDEKLLESLIKKVYRAKNAQDNYFILKSGMQNQRIAVKDVIVMETVGRRVEITLTDRKIYYSGKLSELLDDIPKGFFVRCHQAFAVNIDNIREINRFDAVAVNGKLIPVSRPYMKDTQAAFLLSMQNG